MGTEYVGVIVLFGIEVDEVGEDVFVLSGDWTVDVIGLLDGVRITCSVCAAEVWISGATGWGEFAKGPLQARTARISIIHADIAFEF